MKEKIDGARVVRERIMDEKLVKLLHKLDENVFISSTDSVSGETTQLNPNIEDREATIVISGEWDREDLKKILAEIYSS